MGLVATLRKQLAEALTIATGIINALFDRASHNGDQIIIVIDRNKEEDRKLFDLVDNAIEQRRKK